jgi:hypothetical protein
MQLPPLRAIAVALLLATTAQAYHTARQRAGHQHDGAEGATYHTHHGHEVPQEPYKDCHGDAVRICFPEFDSTHEMWQTGVPMSRMYRCLASKPHLMPRRCHDWVKTQIGCVDDLERYCPGRNLGKTLTCVEENHKHLSDACRSSTWYTRLFAHDHIRVSSPRHHYDPDHEDAVELEDDHLHHDHGYDIHTDDEFSDL